MSGQCLSSDSCGAECRALVVSPRRGECRHQSSVLGDGSGCMTIPVPATELEVQIPLIMVSWCQAQQGRHNTAEPRMGQLIPIENGQSKTRLHGGSLSASPVVLSDIIPLIPQGKEPGPAPQRTDAAVRLARHQMFRLKQNRERSLSPRQGTIFPPY